jgi:hypothetical protein
MGKNDDYASEEDLVLSKADRMKSFISSIMSSNLWIYVAYMIQIVLYLFVKNRYWESHYQLYH